MVLEFSKERIQSQELYHRRVYLACKAKVHLREDLSRLLRELPWPFRKKVTEVEEMSQLGCMHSGNKLYRQKKGH